MTASTHPISMGATPRDETMPCAHCQKLPAGHERNGFSGKLYCYPFDGRASISAEQALIYAPLDLTPAAWSTTATTGSVFAPAVDTKLYRVTASILVKAESAAVAKDRFSDLIDLDSCPSEVEIDAVEVTS